MNKTQLYCNGVRQIVIRDKETPCGGLLEIDLSEYIEEVIKNNNPEYNIFFWNLGEEVVTIDGSVLKIQLTQDKSKEVSVSILVTSDVGKVSLGITVKFESLCEDVECTPSQFCDECTGLCEEGEVDIDATVPVKGKVKFI